MLLLTSLVLSIIFQGAAALPGGCGGILGFMGITSPNFNQLIWTCANIDPRSLFGSGQNGLIASYATPDDQTCGNACAASIGVPNVPGLMAAIKYYKGDLCQCWQIGDIEASDLAPATSVGDNGTFIDFEDLGVASPTAAQDWGIFTCPEGAYKEVNLYDLGQPGIGSCSWVTVIPAQQPIANLGLEGAGICRDVYNAQYAITDADGYVTCYNDLAGAKYYFNYSSPYTLKDLVDFLLPPVTSTSTSTSSSTTSSVVSLTKSSSKSSVKSTSSTKSSSKSSVTSTSTKKSTSTSTSTHKSTATTSKASSSSTVKTTSKSSTKSSTKSA